MHENTDGVVLTASGDSGGQATFEGDLFKESGGATFFDFMLMHNRHCFLTGLLHSQTAHFLASLIAFAGKLCSPGCSLTWVRVFSVVSSIIPLLYHM